MTKRSLPACLAALVSLAAVALLAFGISLLVGPEAEPEKVSSTAMESVNATNRKAKSVFCPSIRTGLFNRSLLFYEKSDKIMFISGSALRDEFLIGCDGEKYWFWMRSFDEGSLYLCDLDELDRTSLIPLMRPEVVKCMAWIDEVEGVATPFGDGFRAEITRGRIKKSVEFDSEKITAQEIFLDGKLAVSLRATEFGIFSGMTLPIKVKAEWHEEGLSGIFTMDRWVVNTRSPEISPPKGLRRKNLEKF